MDSSSLERHSAGEPAEQPKRAACFECRRSKVKCVRDAQTTICRKCRQAGLPCETPDYHVGRYKGVKNKRSGLEKAVHQVEQALKRFKDGSINLELDPDADLGKLISGPQTTSGLQRDINLSAPTMDGQTASPQSQPSIMEAPGIEGSRATQVPAEVCEQPVELALDNADNPLQLLANASMLPGKSPSTSMSMSQVGVLSQIGAVDANAREATLQKFFGSPPPNLDNSPDLDPINLGLVTLEESVFLFTFFYEQLSHTRWGLDPLLHTHDFVRSRSAFLFTSVVAASALFQPDSEALSKRLSNHAKRLVQSVLSNRNRSVEVVLAFMVNVPWMTPTQHWADDEACAYLSMALNIALDLTLQKIVVPSSTIRPAGFLDRVAKADCIEAAKALQLDGFSHVDPTSVWGRRLLRTRERVWLALFVLDRGVCLARGRPFTVPMGPLVESCDTWHIADVGDRWDSSIISAAVLRRDLGPLLSSVREFCYGSQGVNGGSTAVKYLKDKIDSFFQRWYVVWPLQITQGAGEVPPYVEILVSHTKLSVYCNVVNHPTASTDVKQFFRAAGLASAMNVMHAAVQGEDRLKSMPNNTVIMVSFAATFVLALGSGTATNRTTLAPNARALIEETTNVLERIGNTPKQRRGLSVLFAWHIRRILQGSLVGLAAEDQWRLSTTGEQTFEQGRNTENISSFTAPTLAPVPPVQQYISDMTDDQILEAINNASASQELFQLDETMFGDWLDWPNMA